MNPSRIYDILGGRHRDSTAADSSSIEGGDAETANAEKDILRYWYYIRHGIDTQHVAPMEQYWMDNILSLVPKRLQVKRQIIRRGLIFFENTIHPPSLSFPSSSLQDNYPALVESLSEETKEDYLQSVKKAIVDFVLRDPREKDGEDVNLLPEPIRELKLMTPKPWHKAFLAARHSLAKKLHAINPCMLQVMNGTDVSTKP